VLALVHDRPGLHAYLRLSASTGARRGELCGLWWSDVDFVHGAVSISRAIAEGPDGLVIVPTKTRRPHRIELDDHTLGELRRHRRAVLDRAAAAEVPVGREAFVFSHQPDGMVPWCPNWVTKTFIVLRDQVGLAGYRLHDLRHFMATEMLAAGVPIPIVSARLASIVHVLLS
jgi:integrase